MNGAGRQGRSPVIRILVILMLTGSWPERLPLARETVFRCTDGAGQVEFRQTHCPSGEEQRLHVEVPRVGWVKPQASRAGVPSGRRDGRRDPVRESRNPTDRRVELRCWKAEKRLERIQRRLRRGYRASQGDDLRHRRREQQEYLRRFCR